MKGDTYTVVFNNTEYSDNVIAYVDTLTEIIVLKKNETIAHALERCNIEVDTVQLFFKGIPEEVHKFWEK